MGGGSDIYNLCKASNVGISIDVESIPICKKAQIAAISAGIPPWTLPFAIGGDFQFVVTANKSSDEILKSLGFFKIGKITKKLNKELAFVDGTIKPLPRKGHKDVRGLSYYEEILKLTKEANYAK